jgi:hypothetical protein
VSSNTFFLNTLVLHRSDYKMMMMMMMMMMMVVVVVVVMS